MAENQRIDTDLFGTIPVPVAELGAAEKRACLRLIRSENVGPATFRALINTYGGAEEALAAIPEIAQRGGRRRPVRICSLAKAEKELAAADAIGVRPIFTIEPGYPRALAAVDQPPPLIYLKGNAALVNQPTIAIVGSRNCSGAGAAFARRLATQLGEQQIVVVSGLARGIDGAAHSAALQSGTIAVLAGGLDVCYPPEHAELQRQIADIGCIVSECPPGFQPRGKDFPRRNRIISGMSLGVVVVEAAKRSGSLTTARFAAEQGRDVFAVPGHPLDPRSAGTNALLKSGAIVTTDGDDILAELAPQLRTRNSRNRRIPDERKEPYEALSPREDQHANIADKERQRVLALLGPSPVSIDDICRLSQLHARQVQTIVLELSLAGRLEHHGQNLVSLAAYA